jgi:FkbM family methyltransferase
MTKTLMRFLGTVYFKLIPFRVRKFFHPLTNRLISANTQYRLFYQRLFNRLNELETAGIVRFSGISDEQRRLIDGGFNGDFCRKFFDSWMEDGRFNFNGIRLPLPEGWPPRIQEEWQAFLTIFFDTFFFHCFLNDDYAKKNVLAIAPFMIEGPYGYSDGAFDVTVHAGDVVFDAGAWLGDFSAYSAVKGAEVYAFEPVSAKCAVLHETERLNAGTGRIIPVQKALGDKAGTLSLPADPLLGASGPAVFEEAELTTIDRFVEETGLSRVDFIKADIEGAERLMLQGARETLKRFAPRLAICTYHLQDDPEVLEGLIKAANPAYTVVHLDKKLYAAVV